MADNLESITSLDRKIHEPARLAIVMLLYVVEEANFLYIMNQTRLTKGNLSSHLSKLEEAGYVAVEKTIEGKTTCTLCRLTEMGRAAFEAYRSQIAGVVNHQ